MTINELLAAAGLNGTDELPIWNGATQKVTAQQLANAVKTLANLQGQLIFDSTPTAGSSNPVTSYGINTAIQQSTADMTEKIDNEVSIVFGNARTTWADVYDKLDKIPTYKAAVFHCDPNPAKVISNNNSVIGNSTLRGVVSRGATGAFRFMCMAATGASLFAWSISNADTTPIFGSIYRYSGTVVT